jgi:opacity protein-like surface antigen
LKLGIRLFTLLFLLLGVLPAAYSQGNSTDIRAIQLYAFGGITGTYTGLDGGRNLGITAGADLGFKGYFGVLPMLEMRGTYPVDNGQVVGERNFLGGLKVEKAYRSFHPYVDFLFGRGELNYQGIGILNPQQTVLYQRTNTNIFSPGAGVDFDISPSIAIKADFQFQHYDTPVTTQGDIYSKAITIGALYRFGYRQRHPY